MILLHSHKINESVVGLYLKTFTGFLFGTSGFTSNVTYHNKQRNQKNQYDPGFYNKLLHLQSFEMRLLKQSIILDT